MSYNQLNPHFDFYTQTGEQDFYADFVDESIRMYGTECLYIPKDMASIDSILREPYQAAHERFYPIASLLTTPQGYDRGPDILSEIGMHMKAGSSWMISKRMFRALEITDRELRPFEGDLLLIGPYASTPQDPVATNHLFEINFVNKEAQFWALGRQYVWEVQCELYVASREKFETGNSYIDAINEFASNPEEIDLGINDGLEDKANTLVDFDEENPFGDL
jgi:hypothetical protein